MYKCCVFLILLSCSSTAKKPKAQPIIPIKAEEKKKPEYKVMKQKIDSLRLSSKNENLAEMEKRFYHVVVDSILPYWYGTAWDFNGNTQTPRKGAIACGYFVSTVLRDAGLPVNRVRIGQASSQIIINKFCNKKDIQLFYNKPINSLQNHLKTHGKGIYIIGLDTHVGFIVNDGLNLFFIHSKWINPKAVVKENLAGSGIIKSSKYKMIGKLSCNKELLSNWVSN